jgi:hypothetical protein
MDCLMDSSGQGLGYSFDDSSFEGGFIDLLGLHSDLLFRVMGALLLPMTLI